MSEYTQIVEYKSLRKERPRFCMHYIVCSEDDPYSYLAFWRGDQNRFYNAVDISEPIKDNIDYWMCIPDSVGWIKNKNKKIGA